MFEKIKRLFNKLFKKENNKMLLSENTNTNDLPNKDDRNDFLESIRVDTRKPMNNEDLFDFFVRQFESCSNYKDFRKMVEIKRKKAEKLT